MSPWELVEVASSSVFPLLSGDNAPSGAGQRRPLPGALPTLGCCHNYGVPGVPRGGGLMAPRVHSLLLLVLWTLTAPARPGPEEEGDGGW